jgi:hypothetical protein
VNLHSHDTHRDCKNKKQPYQPLQLFGSLLLLCRTRGGLNTSSTYL